MSAAPAILPNVPTLPDFMSARTALNSDATMFSSITPSSDFLVIFFISSSSLKVLPAPKISSNVILKASCTDADPHAGHS